MDRLRISEIDVGTSVVTNEDEVGLKPIVIAPLPASGARLAFMGSDNLVHVIALDVPFPDAHVGCFQCVAQLVFAGAQGALGIVFLGDVFDHVDRVLRLAIRSAHQRDVDMHPYDIAVAMHVALFAPVAVELAAHQGRVHPAVFVEIVRMRDLGERDFGDLFASVA